MHRRDAMLEPRNVQEALTEIDLIPAQADQFGHAQAVAVGDQDQRGVPHAMPTDTRSRLDQCGHLLFRQIFPASVSGIRLPAGNFPFFDGWWVGLQRPGTRRNAHGRLQSFRI